MDNGLSPSVSQVVPASASSTASAAARAVIFSCRTSFHQTDYYSASAG